MSAYYRRKMEDGSTVFYTPQYETAMWIANDGSCIGAFKIRKSAYGDMQIFLPFILLEAEEDDIRSDVAMFLELTDEDLDNLIENIDDALSYGYEEFFDLMQGYGFIESYVLYD